MPIDAISIDFIALKNEKILAELTLLREEMKADRQHNRGNRQTIIHISDGSSDQDRRLGELKDGLETTIKRELSGVMTNLETYSETQVSSAMSNIETRIQGQLQVQTEELHQMIRQAVLDIKAATKNTKVPT